MRDDLEDLRSKQVRYERKVNELNKERNSLFDDKLQLEAKQQDRSNMEEKKEKLEKEITKDDQGNLHNIIVNFFLVR